MGDRFWHKADVGSHGALLGSSACLTWLLWGEGVCVSKVMETLHKCFRFQTLQASSQMDVYQLVPLVMVSCPISGLTTGSLLGRDLGAEADQAWLATVCDPQVFPERPDSLSPLGLCTHWFLSWGGHSLVDLALSSSFNTQLAHCLSDHLLSALGWCTCWVLVHLVPCACTSSVVLRHREICQGNKDEKPLSQASIHSSG